MPALPVHTILVGAHVSLDVRADRLRIVAAVGMSVIYTEYVIRDAGVALELFAYLERHRSRFASVRIT